MSKLNEKDTELYIHEKYIINLSAEENIFTDDVMKKIHHHFQQGEGCRQMGGKLSDMHAFMCM